jgi:hypothetical protein
MVFVSPIPSVRKVAVGIVHAISRLVSSCETQTRRTTMKHSFRSLALFAGLIVAGCTTAPTPEPVPATPPPQFKPAADLKDIMAFVVDYNAKKLWNAVSPKTDEDWHVLQHEAITLGEMGNVIMMPHLAKDNEDWAKFSQGMIDATGGARKATQEKNLDALQAAGDQIVTTCEQCHMKYYPEGVPIDKALPQTH